MSKPTKLFRLSVGGEDGYRWLNVEPSKWYFTHATSLLNAVKQVLIQQGGDPKTAGSIAERKINHFQVKYLIIPPETEDDQPEDFDPTPL